MSRNALNTASDDNSLRALSDLISKIIEISDPKNSSSRARTVKTSTRLRMKEFQINLALLAEKFRDDITNLILFHYKSKSAPDARSERIRKLINAPADINKLLDIAYDIDQIYEDLYDVPAFGRSSRKNLP